ncbi:alkaline phosphatase [Stenotrophomonas sp. PS02289]|uniref:alkaline phosphatase n=1 Tax=Stenotrophomonas sp. PS02289 TaxID=2991422 RepID=UPI00249B9B0A|nr:alkaline phosphatase [Stenotrophomonas sp. PS02289]
MSLIKPLCSARTPLKCASVILLATALAGCQSVQQVDSAASSPAPKNIIVMINDGAGWGTWDAAAYWQYGSREGTPYADFPQRFGVTTFPLNSSSQPTGETNQSISYDPARAWDTTEVPAPDLPFVGYQYLASVATDSAAAGTALSSGVKTYNNAINFNNNGQPVDYSALWAKRRGMATGVVTTVPFSHATPAAFAAQNESRNNYHALAHQMLSQGHMDLIMGAGGPGFDVSGKPCPATPKVDSLDGCDTQWQYVSQEDWQQLQSGTAVGGNPAGPWRLIRSRQDFTRLAQGQLPSDRPLIGVAEVANTLQQARQDAVLGPDGSRPSGTKAVASVPDLATMTTGALEFLKRRSDQGLLLMVEGGATDWAAHTSACGTEWHYGECTDQPQYGRLIEETVDFNNAVAAVVKWVEANGGWERNLVIVTTDHDNSLPMGTDAQRVAFDPVVNHGKGKMPGMTFRPTGNHSNALVPLWAKGVGSERLAGRVKGTDPGYRDHVGLNDGRYIDNTDVAEVVKAEIGAP